jgi:hypothetical protein
MKGGPNWAKNFVDSPIIVDSEHNVFYKQVNHSENFFSKLRVILPLCVRAECMSLATQIGPVKVSKLNDSASLSKGCINSKRGKFVVGKNWFPSISYDFGSEKKSRNGFFTPDLFLIHI